MFKAPSPYHLRPMRLSDIQAVMDIEVKAFPVPWQASAYRYEISQNRLSHYQVLLLNEGDRSAQLVGYAGFWMLAGEAHISTIAVDPKRRCQGLGEILFLSLLRQAYALHAQLATLEVRVSNTAAQALYIKYNFKEVGQRRRYYQGKEDALIMTVEPLDRAYRNFLRVREETLVRRVKSRVEVSRD
jgi:ribosomal-protein-alanine N-acetyltransferase